MKTFILSMLLLNSIISIGQTYSEKIDTFRFVSVGKNIDTFYYTKETLKENEFIKTVYYGLHDNSNLSSSIDTFISGEKQWFKIYNRVKRPFLSIADFALNKKTIEYIDREKGELFYFEYSPIKKFNLNGREFYLYSVRPMSGKGMVESLSEGPFNLVFNFKYGEIYRRTYHIEKVLEGFEEYVKSFKW
jgi:hypothetical protein